MKIGNRFARLACAAIAALAWCGLHPATISAQTSAQPPAQTAPPATSEAARPAAAARPASPDLSITAHVTARELKFNVVPNPTVEFTGKPKRETVWEAERQHLPQSVRPGETYRDIGITLRITSVFADIDRIVAEALGEVPLSEDAPPQPQPPATPPQNPSPPPSQPPPSQQTTETARQTGSAQPSATTHAQDGSALRPASSLPTSHAFVPSTQNRTPRRRDARGGTKQ